MRYTQPFGRSATLALVALTAACAGQSDARAQEQERPTVQEQLGEIPADVDTVTAQRLSSTFRAAAARALPAVVYIEVEAQTEVTRPQIPEPFAPFFDMPQRPRVRQGAGSGFIYSDDGYVITNRHVVADATRVTVTLNDGRVFDAEVVGTDPNTDVAVVKIEPDDGADLPVLSIGDSEALQVGDWVLALGNPLGLNFTVTAGIVSAKQRSIGILQQERGPQALESFIQTDAAINRGNSGGPLVDLYGRAVGVNTAITSPTGAYAGNGFAIPIALVTRVAADLIEYGSVRRPLLGVQITTVNEADAEVYGLDRIAGAEVVTVTPDGPADDAGIRVGDVIVSLNGQPIDQSQELTTRLAQLRPGDEVTLGIVRYGDRRTIRVELGSFEEVETEARTAAADQPRAERVLGFRVEPLTRQAARACEVPADDGVVITEVDPLSPAAGQVARCFVVLSINGEEVDSPRGVERVAQDLEEGDVVSLRVIAPGTETPRIANYRIR